MVAQLTFDFEYLLNLAPIKKTRVRYLVPTYNKFYSIYQYDRLKFRELLNDWLKADEGKNRTVDTLKVKQAQIYESCLLKDDNGKLLRDSDEQHIFRYKLLQNLYEQIYKYCNINLFENFERKEIILPPLSSSLPLGERRLVVWGEDKQAEIKDSEMLPIKDRVLLHIKLLRNLREGFSVEESLRRLK